MVVVPFPSAFFFLMHKMKLRLSLATPCICHAAFSLQTDCLQDSVRSAAKDFRTETPLLFYRLWWPRRIFWWNFCHLAQLFSRELVVEFWRSDKPWKTQV